MYVILGLLSWNNWFKWPLYIISTTVIVYKRNSSNKAEAQVLKLVAVTTYRSSQTLITPSSPGIIIAAFTSSLHPSNFDKRTGFFVELNLSLLEAVAGLISAAIFLTTDRHRQIKNRRASQ
jgi:hypothetical protein